MEAAPLDEIYLRWLYDQVALVDEADGSLTYWKLFKQLYTTKFVWFVRRDRDRSEEGKELRGLFLRTQGIDERDVDPAWMDIECSVLELVIRLAEHLEDFETGGSMAYWFWHLLENIGLRGCHDAVRPYPAEEIEDILVTIIFRQYSMHGDGGFFPRRGPCKDQRSIDLWYQLNGYVLEHLSQAA